LLFVCYIIDFKSKMWLVTGHFSVLNILMYFNWQATSEIT